MEATLSDEMESRFKEMETNELNRLEESHS